MKTLVCLLHIIAFYWEFISYTCTLTLAVITKPQLTQNIFGLILVLWIVFIAEFFPCLFVKRFQSTEVRQFCPRLRIIRSVGIIISHVVDAAFAYGNKIRAQNLFFRCSTQILEDIKQFSKQYYEIVCKFQNEKCQFLYLSLIFFVYFFDVYFSFSQKLNVTFSFGPIDVNQLRFSVVLIWLKIPSSQKYLRKYKSKKNSCQAFFNIPKENGSP